MLAEKGPSELVGRGQGAGRQGGRRQVGRGAGGRWAGGQADW